MEAHEDELAGEGGAFAPGDQATVRLHEGAVSRFGKEHCAGIDAVRIAEFVDVAPAIVAGGGRVAPVILEDRLKFSLNRRNGFEIALLSRKFELLAELFRPSLSRYRGASTLDRHPSMDRGTDPDLLRIDA